MSTEIVGILSPAPRRHQMRGRLPKWDDEAGNGGVIAAVVAAIMAVLLFIAHNAATIAHAIR
jgi:hypothetical protein